MITYVVDTLDNSVTFTDDEPLLFEANKKIRFDINKNNITLVVSGSDVTKLRIVLDPQVIRNLYTMVCMETK